MIVKSSQAQKEMESQICRLQRTRHACVDLKRKFNHLQIIQRKMKDRSQEFREELQKSEKKCPLSRSSTPIPKEGEDRWIESMAWLHLKKKNLILEKQVKQYIIENEKVPNSPTDISQKGPLERMSRSFVDLNDCEKYKKQERPRTPRFRWTDEDEQRMKSYKQDLRKRMPGKWNLRYLNGVAAVALVRDLSNKRKTKQQEDIEDKLLKQRSKEFSYYANRYKLQEKADEYSEEDIARIGDCIADKIISKHKIENKTLLRAREKYLLKKKKAICEKMKIKEQQKQEEKERIEKYREGRLFIKRASAYVKGVITHSIILPDKSLNGKSFMSPVKGKLAKPLTKLGNMSQLHLPQQTHQRSKWTEGPFATYTPSFDIKKKKRYSQKHIEKAARTIQNAAKTYLFRKQILRAIKNKRDIASSFRRENQQSTLDLGL